jgi:predicted nucleic acid-binding Zn ribbon protein
MSGRNGTGAIMPEHCPKCGREINPAEALCQCGANCRAIKAEWDRDSYRQANAAWQEESASLRAEIARIKEVMATREAAYADLAEQATRLRQALVSAVEELRLVDPLWTGLDECEDALNGGKR